MRVHQHASLMMETPICFERPFSMTAASSSILSPTVVCSGVILSPLCTVCFPSFTWTVCLTDNTLFSQPTYVWSKSSVSSGSFVFSLGWPLLIAINFWSFHCQLLQLNFTMGYVTCRNENVILFIVYAQFSVSPLLVVSALRVYCLIEFSILGKWNAHRKHNIIY